MHIEFYSTYAPLPNLYWAMHRSYAFKIKISDGIRLVSKWQATSY